MTRTQVSDPGPMGLLVCFRSGAKIQFYLAVCFIFSLVDFDVNSVDIEVSIRCHLDFTKHFFKI